MHTPTDLPIDQTFTTSVPKRGALVQDRPTLGSLPRARRGAGWWLPPALDLVSSSVALVVVAVAAGSKVFPALPLSPILLVFVYGVLGVYGARDQRGGLGGEDGMAWPVMRLLVAALFAWSASLMVPLGGGAQLALWGIFIVIDTAARSFSSPLLRRLDTVERWVLVGDEVTASRLKAYEPLRAYASVVATIPAADEEVESKGADRVAALQIVDRYRADRVVIATRHADDESLLDLVRAFKSIGVPVSLLPRPLDLLEAPAARPSQVGGVPLIDVEALASRDAVPYVGPDRRQERKTLVSVVVPAMNEAEN
ncbi:MAG: hypothetical protein ACLGG5_08475, partial [Thermoleophilia bacterium]